MEFLFCHQVFFLTQKTKYESKSVFFFQFLNSQKKQGLGLPSTAIAPMVFYLPSSFSVLPSNKRGSLGIKLKKFPEA